MNEISSKRVIDWDNQLRKERDLKNQLGDSWSLSQVKELTGSFRRLSIKDRSIIGKGVLEQCEEFYVSLDALGKNAYSQICKKRSAAHFSINRENSDVDNDPAYKEFVKYDQELDEFKKNNGWEKFNAKD